MKKFSEHKSVLVSEVCDLFKLDSNAVFVDCTIGYGGHTKAIIANTSGLNVYGFDKDLQALEFVHSQFKDNKNVHLIHDDYKNLLQQLSKQNIKCVDGFLFDLGVSSPQLDNPERGFSYKVDAKLDMRMDRTQKKSAWDVINSYSEIELTNIFRNYGESTEPHKIARAIIKARQLQPINTTLELVKVIDAAVSRKYVHQKKHPAKIYFQAIRIAVNDELIYLQETILNAYSMLSDNGCIAVITFHSLEDRLVKQVFNEIVKKNNLPDYLPVKKSQSVQTKVIKPSANEIADNKRARSAKLRVLWKVENE